VKLCSNLPVKLHVLSCTKNKLILTLARFWEFLRCRFFKKPVLVAKWVGYILFIFSFGFSTNNQDSSLYTSSQVFAQLLLARVEEPQQEERVSTSKGRQYSFDLADRLTHYFKQQEKNITFSIEYSQDLETLNASKIEYPATYVSGVNYLKLLDKEGFYKKTVVILTIKESVPVVQKKINPGEIVATEDVLCEWLDLKKVNDFTILEKKEVVGNVCKYVKKKGDVFSKGDIKKPLVITSQQLCYITVKSGLVTITSKGIALKNGAIGSRITVQNHNSNKIIEAIVIDSMNVEVQLE